MSRRLRTAALAIAIAAVFAASAAGAAQAATGLEVALQDDITFVQGSKVPVDKAFDLAAKLQTSYLRVNVLWKNVVKSPGKKKAPKHVTYNWTAYDQIYLAAKRHDVQLQVTLVGPAPAWATGNHKIGVYKPKASAFRDFTRAAAEHFKGLVHRYTVWNEPNYISWISPAKSAAKIYRSLYIAGYGSIKAVDPSAQVLIGETSPYAIPRRAIAPIKFLRDVAKSGHLVADGYAHHPYDFKHGVNYRFPGKDNATLKTIGHLTSALDSLAAKKRLTDSDGRPLDLYLTEWGYMAPGTRYGVSDAKRAKYLPAGFNMALANPRIRQLLQFLLVTPGKQYRFFDMSLLSRKGKRTKPFNALEKWAKNAAAHGKLAEPGSGF